MNSMYKFQYVESNAELSKLCEAGLFWLVYNLIRTYMFFLNFEIEASGFHCFIGTLQAA